VFENAWYGPRGDSVEGVRERHVVGHSFGGMVIGGVTTEYRKIHTLLYLGAFRSELG
jgi:hypothetical protein